MGLVTPENYYTETEHMSVSSYKKFKRCELDGLEPFGDSTPSMMIGSYVDSAVEGTLEQFKNEHPEIFSSRGSSKGQLKSEFQMAEEIYQYILKDKVFSQFMSGEKQVIMTGEIAGVPFKIKMDSYSPHIAINDLKVMRTVTDKNGNFYDFITPWGYDIQLACYQEIVRQNTGEKLLCYICAVTKENPINSIIVNIPQVFLDRALYEVETNIKHFYDIKMGKVKPNPCGVCKTCVSKRETTQIISLEDLVDG